MSGCGVQSYGSYREREIWLTQGSVTAGARDTRGLPRERPECQRQTWERTCRQVQQKKPLSFVSRKSSQEKNIDKMTEGHTASSTEAEQNKERRTARRSASTFQTMKELDPAVTMSWHPVLARHHLGPNSSPPKISAKPATAGSTEAPNKNS